MARMPGFGVACVAVIFVLFAVQETAIHDTSQPPKNLQSLTPEPKFLNLVVKPKTRQSIPHLPSSLEPKIALEVSPWEFPKIGHPNIAP